MNKFALSFSGISGGSTSRALADGTKMPGSNSSALPADKGFAQPSMMAKPITYNPQPAHPTQPATTDQAPPNNNSNTNNSITKNLPSFMQGLFPKDPSNSEDFGGWLGKNPIGQGALGLMAGLGPQMGLPALSWLQQFMSGDTKKWDTLTAGPGGGPGVSPGAEPVGLTDYKTQTDPAQAGNPYTPPTSTASPQAAPKPDGAASVDTTGKPYTAPAGPNPYTSVSKPPPLTGGSVARSTSAPQDMTVPQLNPERTTGSAVGEAAGTVPQLFSKGPTESIVNAANEVPGILRHGFMSPEYQKQKQQNYQEGQAIAGNLGGMANQGYRAYKDTPIQAGGDVAGGILDQAYGSNRLGPVFRKSMDLNKQIEARTGAKNPSTIRAFLEALAGRGEHAQ